jgi:hypothetical protein
MNQTVASTIYYPWQRLKRGEGFFIPSLDTDTTRKLGMREAVRTRVLDGRCMVGIYRGFMGVWFYRLG